MGILFFASITGTMYNLSFLCSSSSFRQSVNVVDSNYFSNWYWSLNIDRIHTITVIKDVHHLFNGNPELLLGLNLVLTWLERIAVWFVNVAYESTVTTTVCFTWWSIICIAYVSLHPLHLARKYIRISTYRFARSLLQEMSINCRTAQMGRMEMSTKAKR